MRSRCRFWLKTLPIGRVTTLDQPIVAGEGRVCFDDAIWLAKGSDLPAGARVKVVDAARKVLSIEAAGQCSLPTFRSGTCEREAPPFSPLAT
jgi:hypothetical protein